MLRSRAHSAHSAKAAVGYELKCELAPHVVSNNRFIVQLSPSSSEDSNAVGIARPSSVCSPVLTIIFLAGGWECTSEGGGLYARTEGTGTALFRGTVRGIDLLVATRLGAGLLRETAGRGGTELDGAGAKDRVAVVSPETRMELYCPLHRSIVKHCFLASKMSKAFTVSLLSYTPAKHTGF